MARAQLKHPAKPWKAVFSFAVWVWVCPPIAHAQPRSHEYVPDIEKAELTLTDPSSGDAVGVISNGEIIAAPEATAPTANDDAMVATPGSGSTDGRSGYRSPTFRPDRITALEGSLGYESVFTPSIAPFKRVSSLDTVALSQNGTPVLGVGNDRRVTVPIESMLDDPPDTRPRDQFWGNVVLDFSAGNVVPLPSVSPESRILRWTTEPATQALAIEKDGAGNFFVRKLSGNVLTRVRVVYLMDAPRVYFNGPIPDGDVDALSAEVAALPPSLKSQALVFAGELGIDTNAGLPDALSKLTEHFRSFEESRSPPPNTGQIYLDLARSMKGVCRHRAYGFVITAHALGIPSRFIMNEAHAWVEVKIRNFGWMRIDLGGAAQGLRPRNLDGKPAYRSEFGDPLPRPQPYLDAYAQARADLPPSLQQQPSIDASDNPPLQRANGRNNRTAERVSSTASAATLVVRVDEQSYRVYRGRNLDVSGRVVSRRGGVPEQGEVGLRIEVLLGTDPPLLLGVTATQDDGYYQLSVGVPPDQEAGEYPLIVRTPGNAHFEAATAQ